MDTLKGNLCAYPVGSSIGPDAVVTEGNTSHGGGGSSDTGGGGSGDAGCGGGGSREVCREIKASGKVKVYSAAGNCLMGNINSDHCMALAWMRSAGVRQMFGYTVPTWFGFGGWGVHR